MEFSRDTGRLLAKSVLNAPDTQDEEQLAIAFLAADEQLTKMEYKMSKLKQGIHHIQKWIDKIQNFLDIISEN